MNCGIAAREATLECPALREQSRKPDNNDLTSKYSTPPIFRPVHTGRALICAANRAIAEPRQKKKESTEVKSVLSSFFSRECSAERQTGRSGGVARGGIGNPVFRGVLYPLLQALAAARQQFSPPPGGGKKRRSPSQGENPRPRVGTSLASCVKAAGTAEPFARAPGGVKKGARPPRAKTSLTASSQTPPR